MSVALLQSFVQPQRMAFYLHPVYGIPLRDLREQFKLKSTFFDAVVVGSEVMLYGKGFGHGVGLCQEGAMQMAKKGYAFDQILQYYYPGASLTK
jgi:stage II sporulation protein D